MCEFCKNAATGNHYKPILSHVIDLGYLGGIDVDVAIRHNNEGKPDLFLDIVNDTEDEIEVNLGRAFYCPICGHHFE